MQISEDQARVLLTILDTYIPIAAPYVSEDIIEVAREIKESLEKDLNDDE